MFLAALKDDDTGGVSPQDQANLRSKLRTVRGGKRGRPKASAEDGGCDHDDDVEDDDCEHRPKRKRAMKKAKGKGADSGDEGDGGVGGVPPKLRKYIKKDKSVKETPSKKVDKVGKSEDKKKTSKGNPKGKSAMKSKAPTPMKSKKVANEEGLGFGCSRCRYASKG